MKGRPPPCSSVSSELRVGPYGQTIGVILPPDLSWQNMSPLASVHIRQLIPLVCGIQGPQVDGGGAPLAAVAKAINADNAISRRMLVLLFENTGRLTTNPAKTVTKSTPV
jgi:hypothetical protein